MNEKRKELILKIFKISSYGGFFLSALLFLTSLVSLIVGSINKTFFNEPLGFLLILIYVLFGIGIWKVSSSMKKTKKIKSHYYVYSLIFMLFAVGGIFWIFSFLSGFIIGISNLSNQPTEYQINYMNNMCEYDCARVEFSEYISVENLDNNYECICFDGSRLELSRIKLTIPEKKDY